MQKDKSPIQSATVSMQSNTSSRGDAISVQGEPWNIHICGDFGFLSKMPERVHVSEWNDFMSRNRVVLAGNVPDVLAGTGKPVFVEYLVESMRHFDAEEIARRAPVCAPYSAAIAALGDLLSGTIDVSRAGAIIERSALSMSDKRALAGILGKTAESAPASFSPNTPGNSGIDSVLAMMDVPPAGKENGGQPPISEASNALFSVVVDGSAITLPRRELEREKSRLEALVDRQVAEIMRAPFFMQRRASWTCLKLAVSAIGRTRGITVSLFSCDRDALDDGFAQVLQSAARQGLPPDIVLVDNEYGFSSADIRSLESIAEAAAGQGCSVIASLDSHDPLFDGIETRDSLAQFFDDVRFLPYKKLHANPAARCVTLCGPHIMVDEAEPITARAGWRIAFAWIDAFLADRPLFEIDRNQAVALAPVSSTPEIPAAIASDAEPWGLTLFCSDASLPVVTILDGDAANPSYTRFGYVLAVNRIVSLAVRHLAAARENQGGGALTGTLRAYLARQLAQSDLIASAEEVSVEADDQGTIVIAVDSGTIVCGYPLRVQFSL